jgi:hypothetical protein
MAAAQSVIYAAIKRQQAENISKIKIWKTVKSIKVKPQCNATSNIAHQIT